MSFLSGFTSSQEFTSQIRIYIKPTNPLHLIHLFELMKVHHFINHFKKLLLKQLLILIKST